MSVQLETIFRESERVRIVQTMGYASRWHLETLLDCCNGEWTPVACSAVDNPTKLLGFMSTIEIMLWEQELRQQKALAQAT